MKRTSVGLPAAALAALSLTACPEPDPEPAPVEFGERFDLAACDTDTVNAHPDSRCFTWRAVAGVSMGGGTSSRLGFNYPELFDVVGMMGTPFADMEALWGMILNNHMSGFCSLEQLEAVMADDPARLDDPTDPEVWCGVHDVWPPENDQQVTTDLPAIPGSECYMFRSDFNHWYRGPEEGRGGRFDRHGLTEVFHDMVAAWGNPMVYNPDSAYFPQGVPESWHVAPQVSTQADKDALCANPVVLEGVYNREYNPDGSYPVITFCDGGRNTGIYDPAAPEAQDNVVEFALAVDLNGNGKRDFAEPLVVNNRERYGDFGADQTPDVDEPGYDAATNPDPAGDNWDPNTNPDGTERNWRWDEGEAFDDDGLDGVPATGDFGEGNGTYDISPTLARLFERSPGALFNAMDDEQVARVDLWLDAGIRDFLNTTQISNAFWSRINKRVETASIYNDFEALPGVGDQPYIYYLPDYSRSAMGQAAYLRYGDPSICPLTDDILGDGNHVGPAIIHRMYTLFGFLSARMPAQGRDRSIGGDVYDLESPGGTISDFGFLTDFYSESLDRDVDYGVLLPPDYYLSDRQDERYPVLYFFHGQGMNAQDMTAIGLILWGSMKESSRQDRIDAGLTDFQRAIIIWADGECLGDTCWTGNFYADFEGLPRDDRRFETAFVELMHHVEDTYRVKAPELVPLSAVK